VTLASRARAVLAQLAAKRSDHSAAEDGLLLWDRGLTAPVVSRAGAFVRLAVKVAAPAAATDPGTEGDYAEDGSYLYICTATNTWRRVAISVW